MTTPRAAVIPGKLRKSWTPKATPWMPHDYDDDVIMAVRQFSEGKANAGQQKLAWDWLMYVTACTEEYADLSFRPGEEGRRATDFAEGKRFVGLQVRKMLHPALNPEAKVEVPEPVARPRRVTRPKKPATRTRKKR